MIIEDTRFFDQRLLQIDFHHLSSIIHTFPVLISRICASRIPHLISRILSIPNAYPIHNDLLNHLNPGDGHVGAKSLTHPIWQVSSICDI